MLLVVVSEIRFEEEVLRMTYRKNYPIRVLSTAPHFNRYMNGFYYTNIPIYSHSDSGVPHPSPHLFTMLVMEHAARHVGSGRLGCPDNKHIV